MNEEDSIKYYHTIKNSPFNYDFVHKLLKNHPNSLNLRNLFASYVIKHKSYDNDKVLVAKKYLDEIKLQHPELFVNELQLCGNYASILVLLDDINACKYFEFCLNKIDNSSGKYTHILKTMVNKYGNFLRKNNLLNKERNLYQKYVDAGLFHSIYHRPEGVVTNVRPPSAFLDPNILPYKQELEDATDIFKAELLSAMEKNVGAWDEAHLTSEDKQWKAIRIGTRHTENRTHFPKTIEFFNNLEKKYNLNYQIKDDSIKFSILKPNTHIVPHCGNVNERVRIHLGLIIPDGAYIRCRTEIKQWRVGKILILSDSYEHEVWNWSQNLRAVLIIDIWDPTMSEVNLNKCLSTDNSG